MYSGYSRIFLEVDYQLRHITYKVKREHLSNQHCDEGAPFVSTVVSLS